MKGFDRFIIKKVEDPFDYNGAYPWKLYAVFKDEPKKGYLAIRAQNYPVIKKEKQYHMAYTEKDLINRIVRVRAVITTDWVEINL